MTCHPTPLGCLSMTSDTRGVVDFPRLTRRDVADQFAVDLRTVSRWVAAGYLPDRRTPTGAFRFTQREIDQLIERQTL